MDNWTLQEQAYERGKQEMLDGYRESDLVALIKLLNKLKLTPYDIRNFLEMNKEK